MKVTILTLISLFFLSIPFSHSQDIKWGPLYKKEGGLFARYNVIGSDDNHYYLNMRPKKKGGTLLKFDYNHKLISNSQIDLKYGKEKLTPSSFITTASKTFAYMPEFEKGNFRVFVSEFNKGKFGKVKQAYKQEFKTQIRAMWFGLTTFTDYDNTNGIEISENKKFVASSSSFSTIDKKTKDKIGFVVFDENMDVVWKKVQNFPYKDKEFNILQVVVSNKGEIFFTASVYDKKKKKDKHQIKYDYKVYHITENSISEIDIKLKNKSQVNEAGLFIHEETNKAYLGGFYSEYGKKKKVNGVFFGAVDLSSESATINIHPFSDKFMEGLASKKAIEKGKGISYSFDINDLITFKDGSFSFLAESNYVTVHTTMDSNGRMTTYYIYHTNDIVIPRFSKDGELLNIEKIEKNFSSRSSSETSYSFNAYNDKIYLVFNDRKNRDERKDIKNSGMKKGKRYTDVCVINNDGSIAYVKTIFTNKETDSYYVPNLSFDHKDKLILGTVTRRKYKFGTMMLK